MENRFWKRLCDHLGVPAYASLQYDEKRRLEIVDCLRTAFKKKTLAEWESELADMDICWGPVRNLQEVLQEPLFRQRNMVVDIRDQKGETTTTLGVPVKLSETPGSIRTPPVNFGESTIPILKELGYNENQIKEFADKGVY